MPHVPFVVEIAPRLVSRRTFEDDTTQRPDVHRTMTSTLVVPDDFRGHVHRRTRETVVGAQVPADRGHTRVRVSASPLDCALVLGEDLCSAEVDIFDDPLVVE